MNTFSENVGRLLHEGGVWRTFGFSQYQNGTLGSKNALGFSAYTGPKIVIGLRPWYKFDKRSDTGSNIENIIPVILKSPSPI